MVDIVDKRTRSRMMAGIRGKDTKPEIKLRSLLHRLGFRFTLHDSRLPGRPDIVLPRWNAVVEVFGCFWHRHPGCQYATTPATRSEYWAEKFARNVERDQSNLQKLNEAGWRTAVIWECWLQREEVADLVEQLGYWIRSKSLSFEYRVAN